MIQRYTHKTSGFKTSETSGLQNVRFTKRQVFKTPGCIMSGFKTSFLLNISERPISKKSIDLTYVIGFHKVCY
jgi:hypothetical protein